MSVVARRYDVNANLVFTWRRDPRFKPTEDGEGTRSFLPVEVLPDAPSSEPAGSRTAGSRSRCRTASLSTVAEQVGAGTVVLRPLHDLIANRVLAAERLHGDDTSMPVLASR